jgi:hypothetical protein
VEAFYRRPKGRRGKRGPIPKGEPSFAVFAAVVIDMRTNKHAYAGTTEYFYTSKSPIGTH